MLLSRATSGSRTGAHHWASMSTRGSAKDSRRRRPVFRHSSSADSISRFAAICALKVVWWGRVKSSSIWKRIIFCIWALSVGLHDKLPLSMFDFPLSIAYLISCTWHNILRCDRDKTCFLWGLMGLLYVVSSILDYCVIAASTKNNQWNQDPF